MATEHNFPILSRPPEPIPDELNNDPTIWSEAEAGYPATRLRHTRLADKFDIQYRYMTETDRATLKAFQAEMGVGGLTFNWIHPKRKTSHEVRIAPGGIKFAMEPRTFDHYMFKFSLVEA